MDEPSAALDKKTEEFIIENLAKFVFNNPSWYLTLIMIGIMIAFAIYNSIKRVKQQMSKELRRIIAFSMVFGALVPGFL